MALHLQIGPMMRLSKITSPSVEEDSTTENAAYLRGAGMGTLKIASLAVEEDSTTRNVAGMGKRADFVELAGGIVTTEDTTIVAGGGVRAATSISTLTRTGMNSEAIGPGAGRIAVASVNVVAQVL